MHEVRQDLMKCFLKRSTIKILLVKGDQRELLFSLLNPPSPVSAGWGCTQHPAAGKLPCWAGSRQQQDAGGRPVQQLVIANGQAMPPARTQAGGI